MIFSKTLVEGNFFIKINDIPIKPCSSVRFVGFDLDPKLNWSKHIEGKCNATQRIIHYLKYCLRRTWGLNTHTLITLYKSIVLPKLLYGCSVWCKAITKKSCVKKHKKVQRNILICITRSFKSASTSSLLVISNLLPINLKIFEFSAHQFISYNKNSFSSLSANTIESVLAGCDLSLPIDKRKRFFSSEFPPWMYHKLKFEVMSSADQHQHLASNSRTLTIWTTAIKTEKGVEIAIVSCSASAMVQSQQSKLPDFVTLEQAHTQALSIALHYAATKKPKYDSCVINIASKNALLASTTESKPTNTESLNRVLLLQHPEYMKLRFLATDTKGFAIANQKAKMAVKQLSTASSNSFPHSPSVLHHVISSKLQEIWNEKWINSKKSKLTRDFFPTIKDALVLKNAYIHHHITQVLTGHSKLNHHLHKIKKISSAMCNCKKENETVEHFIFRCQNYAIQREKILEVSNQLKIRFPPQLSTITREKELWNELAHFVKATGRLDFNQRN